MAAKINAVICQVQCLKQTHSTAISDEDYDDDDDDYDDDDEGYEGGGGGGGSQLAPLPLISSQQMYCSLTHSLTLT